MKNFCLLAAGTIVLLGLFYLTGNLTGPSSGGGGSRSASVINPSGSPGAKSRFPDARKAGVRSLKTQGDLWKRLSHATVLKTETRPIPGGGEIRTSLVHYPGKYASVLVREISKVDPRTGQTVSSQRAMAADHILVKRNDSASQTDFERMLQTKGMQVLGPLSSKGVYMVSFASNDLDSLDRAAGQLSGVREVAFAEPDYLQFTSELVDSRQLVRKTAFGLLDESTAGPVAQTGATSIMVPDAEFVRDDIKNRLESLPAGARILAFDAPNFMSGPGSYSPYVLEQNFLVSVAGGTPGGMYIQNAVSSAYPNNGTNYARVLSGQYDFTVKHADGLPFTASSVDVSEYSISFAAPFSITFVGTKANGQTVSQTFTTDGIIDGTGPQADFQTFTFSSNFTNLTKLVANATAYYMIDNIAVVVEGQETPPVPAPPSPLIYDVTWNAPEHTLNAETSVSGPYAPTTVNFGIPHVRASLGTMTGPLMALESLPANDTSGLTYQQVQFNLNQQAQLYKVTFDAYLNNPDEFDVMVDAPNSYQLINASRSSSGVFPINQLLHIELDLDLTAQTAHLLVNGISTSVTTFSNTVTDIHDIRLHLTGGSGSVGIDNFLVSAYNATSLPSIGPRLTTAPAQFIFPDTAIGSTNSWYLQLENTGGQTLSISSITSNNASFHLTDTFPIQILPGGSYSTKVSFSPTSSGAQGGTLAIVCNDPVQPSMAFPVSGNGLQVPAIRFDPANLLVTMQQGTIGTRTLFIGNSGTGALAWNIVENAVRPATGQDPDPAVTPTDPDFASMWELKDPAVAGAGIDAVHAWSLSTGSPTIKVAVIDTGVDAAHPDLAANIDTANGWDFVHDTPTPTDDNGHGTHVSGTIAAVSNNAVGVAGVAWNCRIVGLKFLDSTGAGFTSDAIDAINYAAAKKIPIVSCSWGGGGFSQSLHDAIAASGCLIVAAAGNAGNDTDASPNYPSGYDCSNIIAVAASDQTDSLAYFSNYGATTVDLAAPGTGILSTYPNQQYAILSGTSMATPHVSGTAALLLSKNPTLTIGQLKQLLAYSSDARASLSGKMISGGRLNAYEALRMTVPSWLNPQITTGSVPAGTSEPIPLTIDTTALAVGEYTQYLFIDSLDPLHPHLQFPVVLDVVPASPLASWQAAHFGSNNMLDSSVGSTVWGAAAQPFSDGTPNLVKYLCGITPSSPMTAADRAGLPVAGADLSVPQKRYLTLTYRKSAAAAAMDVMVETSSDLKTWSRVVPDITRQLSFDSATQASTMEVEVDATDAPVKFIRLGLNPP